MTNDNLHFVDTALSVDTTAVACYGVGTEAAAAQLSTAAAIAAAAGAELLAPAFGPIGLDFLGVYSATGTAHAASIADLATTVHGIGAAARAAAHRYNDTDNHTATTLSAFDAEVRQ